MGNRLAIIFFAGLAVAYLPPVRAAPELVIDKAAPQKEATIDLFIRVTGGQPPTPVADAEISLKGADGTAIDDPKRSDKKGQVRFRQLSKGNVTVVVIAMDWKTFKVTVPIAKPHETVDVRLQSLQDSK